MSLSPFRLSIGLAALLASAGVAHAAPIVLTLNQAAPHTLGPQSTSAPCIIAGTQCQNPAGFDFTNFKQGGNISDYDEVSPTYTVSQFPFLTFNVAIDVNTAKHEETLQLFSVSVDTDGAAGPLGFEEFYTFAGPSLIGNGSANGNGFGDWMLESVDLSSFAADALVSFHAVWDGASGGAESFFLVDTEASPPPPVPEPGTLLLMGLGLLGIGLARWRK